MTHETIKRFPQQNKKRFNVTSIYVASLLEILVIFQELEAALHKYSEKTIFWKHAAKLQLNNKTEERFQ